MIVKVILTTFILQSYIYIICISFKLGIERSLRKHSSFSLSKSRNDELYITSHDVSPKPIRQITEAAPRELTYFYLRNVLRIREASLTNVILKYSWIMYLRVETNLRPTVDVYKSFGFKQSHIRSMVLVKIN